MTASVSKLHWNNRSAILPVSSYFKRINSKSQVFNVLAVLICIAKFAGKHLTCNFTKNRTPLQVFYCGFTRLYTTVEHFQRIAAATSIEITWKH